MRCDRCGGRATTHWQQGDLELDLCGTHSLAHRARLIAAGWFGFLLTRAKA